MNEDNLHIAQFLDGDEKGFEMLVIKYQDRVLNIIYSLIGRDSESEDIAQEVFLKIYNNLRFFRKDSQFSTWLYRIVVNTASSFLRRRVKFVRDEGVIENSPDNGKSPKDALLIREKKAMIEAAISRVPIKFRTAMVLKDIEGLSYVEIAKILRCSIGTVESKIYRARQFLKGDLFRSEGGLI